MKVALFLVGLLAFTFVPPVEAGCSTTQVCAFAGADVVCNGALSTCGYGWYGTASGLGITGKGELTYNLGTLACTYGILVQRQSCSVSRYLTTPGVVYGCAFADMLTTDVPGGSQASHDSDCDNSQGLPYYLEAVDEVKGIVEDAICNGCRLVP